MSLRENIGTFTGAPFTGNPWGIVAEFETPGALLEAARRLREAGYRKFDVHSPFPIHGMNKAQGLGASFIGPLVLGGGAAALAGGLALQIWTMAIDYPVALSGKPYLSIPAFIPVAFETTILFASLTAVFGMLVLNFLPMLYHPLLKHERFARVTDDGFIVSIEARDPRFDPDKTRQLLESLGGTHIDLLEP